MIPQNPQVVIRDKRTGKCMNASTGAYGTGPATVFKDAKKIEWFLSGYAGVGDFELVEVELIEKRVLTLADFKAIKKPKWPRHP